jgi:mono/diheme cytochrome c family protein
MSNKPFFVLIATTVAAATLFASDSKNVTIQTAKASADDGKAMYGNYCAPCHGVDGKGNGPISSSLKRTPTNLTQLSKNNGGVFPEFHVIGVLGHGTSASGHDQSGMPAWAPTLGKIDQNNKLDAPLRISNLTKYVETLQTK